MKSMWNQNVPIEAILNMQFCKSIREEDPPKTYIKGNRGHNSCFFKKPIIQGNFYMQIIGRHPISIKENYKYPPSFRVGIAPTQYYYNYPLGLDYSVGYRMDGIIVQCSRAVGQIQPFGFGDVIGIGVSVKQAFKYRDPCKKVNSSYVQFFKNGKSAGPKQHLLTQDLYTFSASFYNESELSFSISQPSIQYLPPGYQPYSNYINQKCIYKDKQLQMIEYQIENSLSYYWKQMSQDP